MAKFFRPVVLVTAAVGAVALLLAISVFGDDGSSGVPLRMLSSRGVAEVDPSTAAEWTLDPETIPGPDDATFTALVTRVACGGDVPPGVNAPDIEFFEDAVVVTFTVDAVQRDALYFCPGIPGVRYPVDLGQELGDRELVDGGCLPGGYIVTRVQCDDPAV